MRLLVCNGSPSGRASASALIANAVGDGVAAAGAECAVLDLAEPRDMERTIDEFADFDAVVLVIPLYVGSMPALTKALIESLASRVGRPGNPALGFVVHSRFSESHQARSLEPYCERLAERLGSRYLGYAVLGDSIKLADLPAEATAAKLEPLRRIGGAVATGEAFDSEAARQLAAPESLSPRRAAVMRVLLRLPHSQRYWDSRLRASGAFHRRFARPYR